MTASGNPAALELVVGVIIHAASSRPVLVVPSNHNVYVIPERDGDADSLWKLELFNPGGPGGWRDIAHGAFLRGWRRWVRGRH